MGALRLPAALRLGSSSCCKAFLPADCPETRSLRQGARLPYHVFLK